MTSPDQPSFGFFTSSEELGPNEILKAAKAAEAAGFDRLWVSDHYHPWMSSQGSSPFVWSVLGALASTTQLKLTTAVTCPTFRIHPAVIAQAAATTAVLAPGRFTFGVGSGEALNEHILGDAWPPVSVRHARLTEALDIIRQLWTGDVVTYEGKYFTVHNAKLFTLPETPPEILVSGFGPEATKLAAEIGQGWMSASPDADGLKIYRDAGGKGRTQAGAKICWAETEKEAKETAHRLWGHEGGGGQLSQDAPMWLQYEAVAELTSPDDMAKSVPCGPDAARAAEAINEYVEAGFDEIYIAQMGPDQEGGIRFLAEEVLPLLNAGT
jgi:G6PDH family F420-dependent oxidoreductase